MSRIYQPLLGSQSIRLLEIQPGDQESQIACRLVQIPSLECDCPTFEALSYVWGSAVKPKTIVLNDCADFAITQSLYDALSRLRLPDSPRRIWADAICINQDDIDERNRQVRIMRDIYATAVKVCVWLGHDIDGDIDLALVLMATIVQTCEVNARSRGRRWDDLNTEQRFELTKLTQLGQYGYGSNQGTGGFDIDATSPYWDALRNFFARPWFTRIWCVQEIVVARDSIVICGDVEIPWRVVEVTAMWLDAQQMHFDFNVPSLIEGIDVYKPLMMSEAADPVLRSSTMLDALRTFQDFRATDARDKIYAILGITDYDELAGQIPINYNRPIPEVYMETVEAALRLQKDLWALACVQHPHTFDPDPEFPSWVPRWDNMVANSMMLTSDIGIVEFDWRASGDLDLGDFVIFKSNKTIRLKGLTFDNVDFVSNEMDYKDFDFESQSPKASEVLKLWRRFIDPHTTTIPGITRITTFAAALTCETDIDYNHVMDFEDPNDRDEFFTDFLAYMMRLHDQEDNSQSDLSNEKDEHPIDEIGNHTTNERADSARLDSRPSSFPSEDGNPTRYQTAASRMCDQKRFFVTSQGHMGLGPASTREGDLIVVLFGGRVPFMLRKVDLNLRPSSFQLSDQILEEEEDMLFSYHLLGETFVQDIMRGEMIDGMLDGKYAEETFVIV